MTLFVKRHIHRIYKKHIVNFSTVGIALFVLFFMFQKADAAWQEPGPNCDPNVDPTSANCNVSAPINVSSAAQTKNGKLTVKDLEVLGTFTISGGLQIPNNSITSNHIVDETITSTDIQNGSITASDIQSGVFVLSSGNSTIQGSLTIAQTTGVGLQTTATNNGAGIVANTNTTTTYPAIQAYSTGALGSAAGLFTSDKTVAVKGVTNANGQSAVYGESNKTLSYGLKGCNTLSGFCTSIGGQTYALRVDGTGVVLGDFTVTGGTLTTDSITVNGTLGVSTLNITNMLTTKDLAVTSTVSLPSGSINTTNILDGTLQTGDIADGAVSIQKTKSIVRTTVWNPPSITNGAWTTRTVVVPGARQGDVAFAGTNDALNNVIVSTNVTAVDTVRITVIVEPGQTVNLPSTTWTVTVLQ